MRKVQLGREPICRSCEQGGRIVAAVEVDHIQPIRLGGARLDFANLQSLCHECHSKKSRREQGYVPGKYLVPVTLVCGPPGAGKSTYVKEKKGPHDLVLDYDLLVEAMGGDRYADHLVPFVCEARDAAAERLLKPSTINKAWIVTLGSREEQRRQHTDRGAKLVMLDVPAYECKRRIYQRAEFNMWCKLIDKWWSEYDES